MTIYPQTDLKSDSDGNAIGAHDSWYARTTHDIIVHTI
jgi:hypothetical protein